MVSQSRILPLAPSPHTTQRGAAPPLTVRDVQSTGKHAHRTSISLSNLATPAHRRRVGLSRFSLSHVESVDAGVIEFGRAMEAMRPQHMCDLAR
jgi:hypothetical protein